MQDFIPGDRVEFLVDGLGYGVVESEAIDGPFRYITLDDNGRAWVHHRGFIRLVQRRYQIELANRVRRGRVVGNDYVVTRRPERITSILVRCPTRFEAAKWIADQYAARG